MNKRIYFKNFKKVNFIYPKNCLPLWIKNFLYKKNQGVLSEILTGTSFNLTNTIERKFNIFEIQGNTEQTQLTGKNKIDVADTTITGTGSDQYIFRNVSIDNSKNYVLSINYKYNNPTFSSTGALIILVQDGSYTTLARTDSETSGKITTQISNKSQISIYVSGRLTAGSIDLSNFMLEEGTTATSYEPYVGGTASPNPEFPQPIYNVTGDVNVKIQNGDGTKEQNLPFTLGTQRLMLGDVLKDDGIHHKSKRIVLDGTEEYSTNVTQNTENTFYITSTSFDDILGNYLDRLYCTICTQGEVYSTDVANKINIYPKQTQRKLRFRLDINKISSIEEWTTYLAEQYQNGTPVIIEYNINEEETETYTETQQTQYNAIKELYTYEGTTNIEGTSSEISPILKIQYYEKEQ